MNGKPKVVYLYLTKAPDYGIVIIGLNGRYFGQKADCFWAKGVRNPLRLRLAGAPLKKGANVLSLVVIGKNPASRGYYVGLDRFTVR